MVGGLHGVISAQYPKGHRSKGWGHYKPCRRLTTSALTGLDPVFDWLHTQIAFGQSYGTCDYLTASCSLSPWTKSVLHQSLVVTLSFACT